MRNNSIVFFSAFLTILFFSQSLLAQSYDRDDLKYRKWRVTLIPPISTNGLEAPNYTAKYSLNIIGGYHGGLDGVEVGGLFNYTKYYASGFQLAGAANITGGSLEGFNIAGITNIAQDDISGIQIAGFGNIAGDNLEGIQAAGLLNFSGGTTSGLQFAGAGNVSLESIEGLQGSGIFNAAMKDISGLQITGGANIAKDNVEGLQVASAFNFAGADISGLQVTGGANIALGDIEGLMVSGAFNAAMDNSSGLLISGGLNYARKLEGAVISGGANIAKELTGLQFAGLMNISQKATGLQIGLINLAQEFEGMPVGVISLYGNGRKNIDLRYSDAGFSEVGITLGTYRVYNMAILGYNTVLDRDVYRIGLAVGLEKNIQDSFENIASKSLFVNQEVSVLHHFEDEWSRKLNLIYSYKFLVGNRFGNGFSIYGGPSFNAQVTRVPGAADYTWYSLWSPDWKGRQYRFWVGFNVGIRLFKQKNLPLFNSSEFGGFYEDYDDWEIDW